MTLHSWIYANWQRLVAGEDMLVPGNLEHPATLGFTPTRLAENVGQLEDWTLSLADRSRLHVHQFDTHATLHRDRWDPTRGPIELLMHGLFESKTVRALMVVGGIGMATIAVANALDER